VASEAPQNFVDDYGAELLQPVKTFSAVKKNMA
jgi:hypothetical protein